jgi:hypothetical protein
METSKLRKRSLQSLPHPLDHIKSAALLRTISVYYMFTGIQKQQIGEKHHIKFHDLFNSINKTPHIVGEDLHHRRLQSPACILYFHGAPIRRLK